MQRQVICTLDTGDLDEALRITKRLSQHVGSYKIGHSLTLPHGMSVVERLKDAGAERIFLDLKLHDYPDAVGRAVREAGKHGVWMLTLHISGGPAMMQAAVEEANQYSPEKRPLLIGVSVLGSVDQRTLSQHLGVGRTLEEQAMYLSKLAIDYDLDGVGCPASQAAQVRSEVGHAIIVCRGVRSAEKPATSRPSQDYTLIGRVLIDSDDPDSALASFGFGRPAASAV